MFSKIAWFIYKLDQKYVFDLISSYTKPIFRDKGLKQIKNKLTNDKIDCVLEKGNSNENFKGTLMQIWKSCNSFALI